MVVGTKNIVLAREIRERQDGLRWLKLKPFKSIADKERIAELEKEIMWLRLENLTQY